MIGGAVDIAWHGVQARLLPDRAVFLPAERTLLVADVHLGKPASFRAAGVPVPERVTARDLERMTALVRETSAERLIVLGDLIHDAVALRNRTREAVAAWRRGLASVAVDLIVGNHDRRAASCEPLGVRVLGDGVELPGGIWLTHEPPSAAGSTPTLCGHVHPVVSVGPARGTARVRSACFWFDGTVGILPAFGTFTGGRSLGSTTGAAVFAAGEHAVIPVTPEARAIRLEAPFGRAESGR